MKTALRATAAVFALLLAGCPLSSDVALSDPAAASLDTALLGTWESHDPESHDAFTLTITAFNEHELLGLGRGLSDAKGDLTALRMFVTVIGSARFLNIQELTNEGSPGWNFARYEVRGDTLRLRLVDDALFESAVPATPRGLRDVVAAHLEDDALYGGSEAETPVMTLQRRARAATRPATPNPTF